MKQIPKSISSLLWEELTKEALIFAKKNISIQAEACGICLDASRQIFTKNAFLTLQKITNACNMRQHMQSIISGELVNSSEKRAALHTALRNPNLDYLLVKGKNIMPYIKACQEKMRNISDTIRHKLWLGYSGKPIQNIVHIGMGGSYLGPKFCLEALGAFVSAEMQYYFISDADPTHFDQVVKNLSPETTLFIVASKSFETKETIYNLKKAISWINSALFMHQHIIAITEQIKKAEDFGIKTILPIWNFIGGRFSLCSAINLITAIAIGYDNFCQLLAGAHAMDEHFLNAPFEKNLPILLAQIGFWNINFLNINTLLLLTYAKPLEFFTSFVQQLEMESNGKNIDRDGTRIYYSTSPIIWGGLGNQAQHSYLQLLCQGSLSITTDIITVDTYEDELINHMSKKTIAMIASKINHIKLSNLSAFTIGALAAMYEHKVYVQSIFWYLNPFDQPGVEKAKSPCYDETL